MKLEIKMWLQMKLQMKLDVEAATKTKNEIIDESKNDSGQKVSDENAVKSTYSR